MKKSIKKIMSIILIIAMMTSMWSGINVFATGSINVGIVADKATILPNTDVTITAGASDFSGVTDGIVGFTVKINYDATKFDYIINSETLLQGQPLDGNISVNDVKASGILYVLYDVEYTTVAPKVARFPLQAGDLFSVKFTAKASYTGSATFEISGTNASDNFADNSANQQVSSIAATFPTPGNLVEIGQTAKAPLSITFKTTPTKTSYIEGQTLDLTGGVITLTYNDSTTMDITLPDLNILASGFNSATVGTQNVTLKHTGVATGVTYDVTVATPQGKSLIANLSSDLTTVAQSGKIILTGSFSNYIGVKDGIIAYSVKIIYDSSKFSYVDGSEMIIQGTLGDGVLEVNDDVVAGELNIVYLDNFTVVEPFVAKHPLTAGNIFSVKFAPKALATGSGNFTIASLTAGANFADNEVNYPDYTVNSTYSNPVSVSIEESILAPGKPGTPTLVSKTSTTIKISWLAVPLAVSYNVYINGTKNNIAIISALDYNTTGLTKTTEYTITITAVNTIGESIISDALIVTTSSVTLGDINGDGNVKIADAMMVFQHVSGKITLTASQMEAADINGDGLIKIADAMRIFQFVSGKNPTL